VKYISIWAYIEPVVVFTGKMNAKCGSLPRRELSLAFGGQIESFMIDRLVAKNCGSLVAKKCD